MARSPCSRCRCHLIEQLGHPRPAFSHHCCSKLERADQNEEQASGQVSVMAPAPIDMLSEKVGVKRSGGQQEWRSLIALDLIPAGELVWQLVERCGQALQVFTRRQLLGMEGERGRQMRRSSYMVGPDAFSCTDDMEQDPSWFFNHSCEGKRTGEGG